MPPPNPTPEGSPEARNAEAKVWMKRGIALLTAATPSSLPEALQCFDHALAIRRQLPYDSSSFYRWLLTACWMNRGDVLTRLGTPSDLTAAIHSFDEAIHHLQQLPLDEDPQYRSRLALAWMNRSLALRASGCHQEALHSLECAQSVLRESSPPSPSMQATLLVNRAALLLEIAPPRMLESMQAAEEVLALCHPTEHHQLQAAEIGLKARHIFCRAVALLLETPPVDTSRADDWIHQATDKVDEAMHLTAHWERHGIPAHFMALRHQLFQFGCNLLLAYQPHFMAEFLLDVLDPAQASPLLAQDQALYQAGLQALDLASAELRRRGPLDLGLQGMDRLLAVLRSLSSAAQRIQQRAEAPSAPA
jgi:tetratricopeptide (TPR) repeat protein